MEILKQDKFILDATAGYRQIWFDKNNPHTLYLDQRSGIEIIEDIKKHKLNRKKPRPSKKLLDLSNTVKGDFRKTNYPSESFKLIVWDPPYYTNNKSKTSWMYLYFGALEPETWQSDLKQGANELFRLLVPYGILIFKWNNKQIPVKDVLKLFPVRPLFGQRLNNIGSEKKVKKHSTFWLCFMKFPTVGDK